MRLKKHSLIIAATWLVVACGSKEQEPELISFDELAGETGVEQNQVAPAQANVYDHLPQFKAFVFGQLMQYDTSQNVAQHPLDRFGFSSATKLNFTRIIAPSTSNDPVPQAALYYYTFSDSLKTKNAFYNWLDCFGNDCEAVQLNQRLDKLDTDPAFVLVYDTTIVAAEYSCNDPKGTWKSFQDSLITHFGKSYKYRLEVKCKGPVEWK